MFQEWKCCFLFIWAELNFVPTIPHPSFIFSIKGTIELSKDSLPTNWFSCLFSMQK